MVEPINALESNTRKLTLLTSSALKFSVQLCRENWEQCPQWKRGQAGTLQQVSLHPRTLGDLPGAVLQDSHPAGEPGGPSVAPEGQPNLMIWNPLGLHRLLYLIKNKTIKMSWKTLKLSFKQWQKFACVFWAGDIMGGSGNSQTT